MPRAAVLVVGTPMPAPRLQSPAGRGGWCCRTHGTYTSMPSVADRQRPIIDGLVGDWRRENGRQRDKSDRRPVGYT